jgi:Caspase domain
MRLPIIALATALLVSILPTSTSAQTGNGVVDIWLKVRESADAPTTDQKVTLYTTSKALVIGMDAYDGHNWPKLSNGVKDAEEVAKGLAAQGFEVTLKKDLKSDELDRALRNFFIIEGDDPNARLLLWFAGHGDTIDGEAYLVPADAPSPKFDAEFRDKAISLRRFGEYMREAKARHVLAIFDSCFSGGVFNIGRSRPPPAITLATTQPVREFISSGEAEQVVSDDGTFRKLFLDVLSGKEPDADANHDGYVTGTELGLFLMQKMTDLTNNRQTPRYGKLNAYGYDRGDFVFQVGPPEVPATPPAATQAPSETEQAWAATRNTTSRAVLEDFIKRYGGSSYGTLARSRLEELEKSQVAAVAPQPPSPVPNTQVAAPVTPTANAPNGTAAVPDEVAWSFVKETHDSDQLRRFITQFPRSGHLVEAAEKLAALQQHTAEATDIAKKLQTELRRVGCFAADPDGDWNTGSISALESFNRYSGSSLDTKIASLDALEAVRSKPERICPLICRSGYHADGDHCVPTMRQRATERHYRAEQRGWRYGPPQPIYGPSQANKGLPPGVKIGCPPAVMPCP